MHKRFTHILLALVIMILLPERAPAQTRGNNLKLSVDVSATVLASSIEIITLRSINLSEADRRGNIITVDPASSTNAGKMVAVGTPYREFRISFFRQHELTHANSSNNLTFYYSVAGYKDDDQTTAELLDQDNRAFEFNEEGRFYLWVGGRVDITNAAPGTYQGEFTLEIDYI